MPVGATNCANRTRILYEHIMLRPGGRWYRVAVLRLPQERARPRSPKSPQTPLDRGHPLSFMRRNCGGRQSAMLKRMLPAGFVVPAQPVERDKPPVGAGWDHEIKHDGIRLLVRRDGTSVRLFTRKGNDWSDRFPAISAAAAGWKCHGNCLFDRRSGAEANRDAARGCTKRNGDRISGCRAGRAARLIPGDCRSDIFHPLMSV